MSDRGGNTAGDCDVVVFNDTWFPTVKQRATADDRQHVMPIEGAYAVIEVKQTLTQRSLDEALGKLVTCHRLDRPLMPVGRMVENRSFGGSGNRIGNPLFSAIVATRRDPDTPMSDLVERFLAVNRRLNRLEMVHCLCVLGEACYLWGWVPQGGCDVVQRPRHVGFGRPQLAGTSRLADVLKWPRSREGDRGRNFNGGFGRGLWAVQLWGIQRPMSSSSVKSS
ncbi:DUF6602 domain-containing protein [Streptomyces sp. NPDC020681]|uniref:DUF6602 domain-containing protein n=1 Tax=Streptomyces sp. NPDC020681 TaxID=3365083 RepID=UPI0037886C7D